MKKFILLVTAIGLVLTVGLAFADAPMAIDMRSVVKDDGITYSPLDNGVTFVGVLDRGIQCYSEGAAAGGMAAEVKSDLRGILQDDGLTYGAGDNGVTFAAIGFGPKCSWERGPGADLELHNSITIPGGTVDQ